MSCAQSMHALLLEVDREFVPPLSSRESTLQADLVTAAGSGPGVERYLTALMGQGLLVVGSSGDPFVGFASFIPGHVVHVVDHVPLGPYHYLTTIAVAHRARQRGAARALYEALLTTAGHAREGVATRTWSGNRHHIALLRSLGFAEVIRLQNDRGPEVDTIYFARDWDGVT